ncbi:MAG: thioredoxin family protein [Candidatus Omnitrophota bacterium]
MAEKGKGKSSNRLGRRLIFLIAGMVLAVIVATITVSDSDRKSESAAQPKLPRLVDLGAGKCIPCKMMAPILAELKNEYAGALDVEVIDIYEDQSAARKYKIRLIPTQIFLDREGKEIYRHEGFMSKEDILEQWKKSGFDLVKNKKSEQKNRVEK